MEEKYGLIGYTYNNGISEYDYNYPGNSNIGDSIQSLAALQFLPHVDVIIDRDQLNFCNKKVKMIMNGWYKIWRKNDEFSKNINPLMVSIHINNKEELSKKTLDYLKKHEPIGCRDYETMNFLIKKDIDAYFSGCLTLTLGNTYKINHQNRDKKIYFVDYNFSDNKNRLINKELIKILRKYKNFETYKVTHIDSYEESPWKSICKAEDLIRNYAQIDVDE